MDIEHKAIHCIGNIHPRMIVDRNKELSATEYQQRNIESKEASAWVKGAKTYNTSTDGIVYECKRKILIEGQGMDTASRVYKALTAAFFFFSSSIISSKRLGAAVGGAVPIAPAVSSKRTCSTTSSIYKTKRNENE